MDRKRPIGVKGGPPSLNLVGDFGGGMFLAFGMVCAVFRAEVSGIGQVVDAAMVDGASVLSTAMFGRLAEGKPPESRDASQLIWLAALAAPPAQRAVVASHGGSQQGLARQCSV